MGSAEFEREIPDEVMPMNISFPAVLALAASLVAAAFLAVCADGQQTRPPPAREQRGAGPGGPGAGRVPGPGRDRKGLRGDMMRRGSPGGRASMIDARIAAVKAGLRLTPDQDKLWPPLEQA